MIVFHTMCALFKRNLSFLLPALLFICLFPISHAYGYEFMGQECSLCHMLDKKEAKDLLKNIILEPEILDIRLSSVKGFWDVYLESKGRKVLVYVDFPKKHLFLGSLISIGDRRNLTQERLTELNKVNISQIPLEGALTMGDPKARIRVIVFTDID
ncbi:MAG: disulfide isomerase DsbC N-terminal domain-containing protein [Thermodesulfobacteriota bacterium]